MPRDVKINWQGPKVQGKVLKAAQRGIDQTMSETVQHAKRNHAWQNRTGTLEGSIAIAQYARKTPRGVRGAWGSKDVVYALIHELGGLAGRGRKVRIPARPYLRPAARAIYPRLAAHIKRALK